MSNQDAPCIYMQIPIPPFSAEFPELVYPFISSNGLSIRGIDVCVRLTARHNSDLHAIRHIEPVQIEGERGRATISRSYRRCLRLSPRPFSPPAFPLYREHKSDPEKPSTIRYRGWCRRCTGGSGENPASLWGWHAKNYNGQPLVAEYTEKSVSIRKNDQDFSLTDVNIAGRRPSSEES